MERRTVMQSLAMGALIGAMMVATKGQTTAAQPNIGQNQAGDKGMLEAQTLADRYAAVWNEKDEAEATRRHCRTVGTGRPALCSGTGGAGL